VLRVCINICLSHSWLTDLCKMLRTKMSSNLVFYFILKPRRVFHGQQFRFQVRHARHTQVGDVRDYNIRLFLVMVNIPTAWSCR
jgi:hypothetical protein